MDHKRFVDTLGLLFAGVFLQIFTLNIFDIAGVPSGRIITIAGFVFLFIALYRLRGEESKFNVVFVLSIIVFAGILALTVLEVCGFNDLAKVSQDSLDAITSEYFSRYLIYIIVGIVIGAIQLFFFLKLIQATIELGRYKKIPKIIVELGRKRHKTMLVCGIIGVAGNLLGISTMQATRRLVEYYQKTGHADIGAINTITLNSFLVLAAVIVYIVGLIMMLVYLKRFKDSFSLVPAKPEGEPQESPSQDIIDNDATIVKDDKPWDDEIK